MGRHSGFNAASTLRSTTPHMTTRPFGSSHRVASSDSLHAHVDGWKPAPLRSVVLPRESSRGQCSKHVNVDNCLEVVVGGEVLEEVALLLHDAVELIDVDLTIAITVSLVDHVLELLIVDVLAELLSHASEVAEGDLVGVVVVEQLEHLLDVLAGVLLAHLASHHVQEFGELDGAVAIVVDVSDHLLELLVLDLEAKGTHGGLELTHVNGTGSISVEKAESLTDLLHLLVGESSLLLS